MRKQDEKLDSRAAKKGGKKLEGSNCTMDICMKNLLGGTGKETQYEF